MTGVQTCALPIWNWKPANNTAYYQMPRGAPVLDPAWALLQRLGGGLALSWVPAKKTGIALEFCLHPWFLLDVRGQGDCPP